MIYVRLKNRLMHEDIDGGHNIYWKTVLLCLWNVS